MHETELGNPGGSTLVAICLLVYQWLQRILEDPHIFISWLTPTWLMSLRQFLYNHSISITLTDCWHVPLCCKHDQYLMEPALSDRSFIYSDYEHINCVRLYLQVATLSDISDGNG